MCLGAAPLTPSPSVQHWQTEFTFIPGYPRLNVSVILLLLLRCYRPGTPCSKGPQPVHQNLQRVGTESTANVRQPALMCCSQCCLLV